MHFMRQTKRLLGLAAIIAVIGFMALPLTGCSQDDIKDALIKGIQVEEDITTEEEIIVEEDTRIKVKLIDVVADGSDWQKTTKLTLTFTDEIPELSADDITLIGITGVTKGTLSDLEVVNSFPTYTLPISGFTNAGNISVRVKKSGYNVITESDPAKIFYIDLMVKIPAGTFIMGSPNTEPNRVSDETQHSVTLSEFYLGKYLVTQGQWKVVMGKTIEEQTLTKVSEYSNYYKDDYGRGDNYPVYFVSWYDALVFCNKLSVIEGLDPVYSISDSTNPADWGAIPTTSNATWNKAVMDMSKNGYRLPTEAEWEYACRGYYQDKATERNTKPFGIGDGTKMIKGMANFFSKYPYDSNQGEYVDAEGINFNKTTAVGCYEPNNYGLYDMHGNLVEYCWDWYKADITEDIMNPTGAATGTNRVVRGGYWDNNAQYMRSAFRWTYNPRTANVYIGFRVARSGN